MAAVLTDSVRRLFWDVSPASVDIRRHARFIIRRVLDYGDAETLNWLRRTYSEDEIRAVVASGRGLARKTLAFWNQYFKASFPEPHV
jgi:hypothetical protein